MKIRITPERRMIDNGTRREVGVRIALTMEGTTIADKEELDRIWNELEKDDSVKALLALMGKMAGWSDSPPG